MKLAQYAHLAPKITFLAQFSGAAIGALLNFVLMNSIVDNQRDILLSVEGTNVWSGQYVQQFNTLVSAFAVCGSKLLLINPSPSHSAASPMNSSPLEANISGSLS